MRIEFNALGDLKKVTNLDKDLTVSMTAQGFYWYASEYSPYNNTIKT